MSNIAKVLKAEIARISRREAKTAVGAIGKSHTVVRENRGRSEEKSRFP